MSKLRKWIKRKWHLYDISDLQVGEHCGLCGKWIPDEISPKEWAVGICNNCKPGHLKNIEHFPHLKKGR